LTEKTHTTIANRIAQTLRRDRFALRVTLGRIESLRKKAGDRTAINDMTAALEKRLQRAEQHKLRRIAHRPKVTYPGELPITEKRTEIIEAIRRHQVVVVTGETGSGKTTQLPKMCLDAGRGIDGVIGCTQPRRIAALTIAGRLAEEMGEPPGRSVGYKIRFDDRTNRQGYIKLMTDGILLMEAQGDQFLNEYDTLIIDEAHERSANIDFILGMLKNLIKKRTDLTLIITSATIDPEKFSHAFDNAPIIEVSGRMYPVEIRYRPPELFLDQNGEANHVEAALHAVSELKKEHRRGHTLIFMPTEQDIRETCELLEGTRYRNSLVLPLFGRLSSADQRRIFQPTREEKLIVATNVAETSITIPGIRYVIDTGLARIAHYNPVTRTKGLPVKPISQSSAIQRAGRCGRMESGICLRLYSMDDYETRPLFTAPEILRSNLAEVILRMMALKIGDISNFPFIDPPRPKAIKDGYDILKELGSIQRQGKSYALTERGRLMARMPLDPRIARMIREAQHQHCVEEIIIIAAALSIQDPRERPMDKEAASDEAHRRFVNPSSDFLTFLSIWSHFRNAQHTEKSQNRMRKFCRDYFLSYRRMKEWCDLYDQIVRIIEENGNSSPIKKSRLEGEALYEAIHKSIIAGYLSQIGLKKTKNIYRTAKGKEIMIFPGSGLFNRGGDWIIASETVETSRLFARTAATVKSEWLEEIGKEFCRYRYAEPRWDSARGEVVATEQVTLYGLPLVTGRTVSFGAVNPQEATKVFIRSALVEGEPSVTFPFLDYNRALIKKIVTMENKIRKRNILVTDDDLAEFYESRLGTIFDIRTLRKRIRDERSDGFLRMSEEDVRTCIPDKDLLSLYPDSISLGTTPLKVTYRFEPGAARDGVTVRIPAGIVADIPSESADWHIPGLMEEKITALIKGLPKDYRRQLIPISRTVEIIGQDIASEAKEGSILAALSKCIYRRFGLSIPATAWSLDDIPDYLKIRYALTDGKGKELKAVRDIELLKDTSIKGKGAPVFENARARYTLEGITEWNFGDIPEHIPLAAKGRSPGFAYPALKDEKTTVTRTLYASEEDARREHAEGVRRLFTLQFGKDIKYLKHCLSLPREIRTAAAYFGGSAHIENRLFQMALHLLIDCTVRNQDAFVQAMEKARPRIYETAVQCLTMINEILRSYSELRLQLQNLQQTNPANKKIGEFIGAVYKELDHLLPEDFLSRYDEEVLVKMPRYIRALAIRVNRGTAHLDKDRLKAEKLQKVTEALRTLEDTLPPFSSSGKLQALNELRWMIEEYKISLFAPELKTLFPVSPKRLQQKVEEIQNMI